MTISHRKLEKYLSIHGTDFTTWPDPSLANAAQSTIQKSEKAKHIYSEALSLEHSLQTLKDISYDTVSLEKTIMAAIEREKERPSRSTVTKPPRHPGRIWATSSAIAASIVIITILSVIQFPFKPQFVPPQKNTITVVTVDAVLNKIQQEQIKMAQEEALMADFFDLASSQKHPRSSEETDTKDMPEKTRPVDPEVELLLDELYGIGGASDFFPAES